VHAFFKFRASIHAGFFLVLLVFVYLLARSRFLAPISWDEELFIWQGWLVRSGSVPYRDFFEPKPPLIFLINALALALFGLKDNLFRVVPTAVALGAIGLFYLALMKRRVLSWIAILLTAQVALWLLGSDFHDMGLNDTETYGFAFTLAGFSLGFLSRRPASRPRQIMMQVASGILFGLAVSSKELFLLSAVPAWFLAARSIDDEKWDWRYLFWSGLGTAIVALLTVAYLTWHSVLGAYLGLVRFYAPLAANYCIDIGMFPKVSGVAAIYPSWIRLQNSLYNFKQLAFVLPLCAASLLAFHRKGKWLQVATQLALAVLAVLLGMVAISTGHCFFRHYFLMGVMGLILLAVPGAEALSRFLSKQSSFVSFLFFTGFAFLFICVAAAQTKIVLTEKHLPYSYPWDSLVAETVEKHSRPGDYILSTDSPFIYVILNRKNPLPLGAFTDEILPYMARGNPAVRLESFRQELEAHPPKVFYFAGVMRARQEKFHQLLFDPFLIDHHYVKVDDRLWYLPKEE
jgi:hypothetical protein